MHNQGFFRGQPFLPLVIKGGLDSYLYDVHFMLWSTAVGKVAIQQASYQKSMALIILLQVGIKENAKVIITWLRHTTS